MAVLEGGFWIGMVRYHGWIAGSGRFEPFRSRGFLQGGGRERARDEQSLFSALENRPFYNLSIEDEVLRFFVGKNEGMVGFNKMNFRNVFWTSGIIVFGGHAIAELLLSFGESSILQFIHRG